MTSDELQSKRIQLWHADSAHALERPEEIVGFLRNLQWCYILPKRMRSYPSLLHAVTGTADSRVTPARLDLLRLVMGDLWEYTQMSRSIVEVHLFGHGPMFATRDFCRNAGVFLFEGKSSPRRMLRERQIGSLEREILDAVRREALTKREIRDALNIRTRSGLTELEQAVRSLERRLLLLRSGRSDEGKPLFRSSVALLGIRTFRFSENQRRKAADILIRNYVDAVVADSRWGIKSFFRGIIPPAVIDAVLYDLLLRSVLKVDSSLIINGKRALLNRKP